eukprot:6172853-Pleurochrysis_carterae.AAC.2
MAHMPTRTRTPMLAFGALRRRPCAMTAVAVKELCNLSLADSLAMSSRHQRLSWLAAARRTSFAACRMC